METNIDIQFTGKILQKIRNHHEVASLRKKIHERVLTKFKAFNPKTDKMTYGDLEKKGMHFGKPIAGVSVDLMSELAWSVGMADVTVKFEVKYRMVRNKDGDYIATAVLDWRLDDTLDYRPNAGTPAKNYKDARSLKYNLGAITLGTLYHDILGFRETPSWAEWTETRTFDKDSK